MKIVSDGFNIMSRFTIVNNSLICLYLTVVINIWFTNLNCLYL